MSTALVRYDAACRAVAEAKAVDELIEIRDQTAAMQAAARVVKNRQLEADAAEIRMRAERRIGEMMASQHAQGRKPRQLLRLRRAAAAAERV